MERLIAEITRLCEEIERDFRELIRDSTQSNQSNESRQRAESDRLGRLEKRVDSISNEIRSLWSVVREALSQGRGQLPRRSPPLTARSRTNSPEPTTELGPQERSAVAFCSEQGPVTYSELGQHLGITTTSAKNLVNRLLAQEKKRHLLHKDYIDGKVTVRAPSAVIERKAEPERDSVSNKKPSRKHVAITVPAH